MNQIQSKSVKELVINWHITEVCNYSCQFCYAKWDKKNTEIIHDDNKTRKLIDSIFTFFAEKKLSNYLNFENIRLNLAGGEPLLYPGKVLKIIKHAHQIGFSTSIISNGSRMNNSLMKELAPCLSILGISLDSFKREANQEIGRTDRHSRVLEIGQLIKTIEIGRQLNPDLQLKINTVVNAINRLEDMNPIIFNFSPDKWKILRMLPTVTDSLGVTDSEFEAFVQRHRSLEKIIRVEDNVDMTESYIMIDPHGRFFQNTKEGHSYQYSQPILEVGAKAAFSAIKWSHEKFSSRYINEQEVV